MKVKRFGIKVCAGAGGLIFLDQMAKYMIRSQGGFYICNNGIAFGIHIPGAIVVFLLGFIFLYTLLISKPKSLISNKKLNSKSFDFVSWIFDFLFAGRRRICSWDFSFWFLLILSGAISNLADRAMYGCVIDYIDLKFWPVFNLADIYITIGGIILAKKILSNREDKK